MVDSRDGGWAITGIEGGGGREEEEEDEEDEEDEEVDKVDRRGSRADTGVLRTGGGAGEGTGDWKAWYVMRHTSNHVVLL